MKKELFKVVFPEERRGMIPIGQAVANTPIEAANKLEGLIKKFYWDGDGNSDAEVNDPTPVPSTGVLV